MARIIPFTAPASKFGFQRAQKRTGGKGSQFDLFHTSKVLTFPGSVSAFEEALRHDEHGDTDAVECYRQAIEQDDHTADAYCNLGVLASSREDRKEAFQCFTSALKADPRHYESHYNLGNLYFDMGNLDLARHHFEFAATLAPDFPNVYFNLGLVLAMQKELQSAVDALTRYQELAGDGEAAKANTLLDTLHRSLSIAKKESS